MTLDGFVRRKERSALLAGEFSNPKQAHLTPSLPGFSPSPRTHLPKQNQVVS